MDYSIHILQNEVILLASFLVPLILTLYKKEKTIKLREIPFSDDGKTHFQPRKDICTTQDFSFNDSIGPILWQFLGIYSQIVVEMGIGKGKLETSFVSINYFPTFAVFNLHNLS